MYLVALNLIIILACVGGVKIEPRITDLSAEANGDWSPWSKCSVTCGEGQRRRQKKSKSSDSEYFDVKTETKQCFLQFCPSYLSWTRIHFSGKMLVDAATINNFRCAYDNEKFSAAMQTEDYFVLQEKRSTHVFYEERLQNWNPDGSNRIYYVDTFVTSYCGGPNNCSLTDSIVGSKVTATIPGAVACVGPDWQVDEIWVLQVHIPGIMTAQLLPTARRSMARRYDDFTNVNSNDARLMTRFKSKLVNLTWKDDYYKNAFSDAHELSVTFVCDLFNVKTRTTRISGTIGLTSPDDARQVTTTRVLQSVGKSFSKFLKSAPFFVHYSHKTMTVDLALSLSKNNDEHSPDTGNLDLALILTKKEYCRNSKTSCNWTRGENELIFKRISNGGRIPRNINSDSTWYMRYGGVLDIDLSHVDDKTMMLLKYTRIALIDRNNSVHLEEFQHGLNIGLMEFSSLRLDKGDIATFHGFVSSFGRPAKNAQFNLLKARPGLTDIECSYNDCNRSLGVPTEAITISVNHRPLLTNRSGLVRLDVKAVEDPANPRGCGLDGQIYPLQVFVRYTYEGQSFTYSDHDLTLNDRAKPADFVSNEVPTVVKVYSFVSEKACPTWNDVKDIFIRYHNLYPIMGKTGIINLHSYESILRHAKILKTAMFDLDVTDPNYMPIARDLSKGKKKLIYNWIKCGMKKEESGQNSNRHFTCNDDEIEKGIEEIRSLLHKAMMLELSLIPPYVTAWLSLKTEFGRNKEIAEILKSVFREEMLHLVLDANILNAVGGIANMTDRSRLPAYPSIFSSDESLQILPDIMLALGPFSIGLVQDVFSMVEKPSGPFGREVMYNLAEIWKILPSSSSEGQVSHNMKKLLREYEERDGSKSKLLERIKGISSIQNRNETRDLKTDLQSWKKLAIFASDNLNNITKFTARTVGEFYSEIALKLTLLESCLQIRNLEFLLKKKGAQEPREKTLFTGNASHQLNISHWYEPSSTAIVAVVESIGGDLTTPRMIELQKKSNSFHVRPPLFEVSDLKTALEATVEIVYQGEGGSVCSPFIPEPDVYASEKGRDEGSELPHYYLFQEIVNGRKLVKSTRPPDYLNCLNISRPDLCPSFVKNGERYCYAGDQITFFEDGVWPILLNPKEVYHISNAEAHLLQNQFNSLYSSLLNCLENAFSGNPYQIRKCMPLMYQLTTTGKRLVQTPLTEANGKYSNVDKNAAPAWQYVPEVTHRAGLPMQDAG